VGHRASFDVIDSKPPVLRLRNSMSIVPGAGILAHSAGRSCIIQGEGCRGWRGERPGRAPRSARSADTGPPGSGWLAIVTFNAAGFEYQYTGGERWLRASCTAAIAALALAWSAADGPLRLEPQSMASSPRTVTREAAEEKVDRLRRQMDALQNASTAGVRSYLVARAHQRRHLLRTLRLMHGALASLPRAFGPTSTIETPS
jgi:hypothetical protein